MNASMSFVRCGVTSEYRLATELRIVNGFWEVELSGDAVEAGAAAEAGGPRLGPIV